MNTVDMIADKYLFKRCSSDYSHSNGSFIELQIFGDGETVALPKNVETTVVSFMPRVSGSINVEARVSEESTIYMYVYKGDELISKGIGTGEYIVEANPRIEAFTKYTIKLKPTLNRVATYVKLYGSLIDKSDRLFSRVD